MSNLFIKSEYEILQISENGPICNVCQKRLNLLVGYIHLSKQKCDHFQKMKQNKNVQLRHLKCFVQWFEQLGTDSVPYIFFWLVSAPFLVILHVIQFSHLPSIFGIHKENFLSNEISTFYPETAIHQSSFLSIIPRCNHTKTLVEIWTSQNDIKCWSLRLHHNTVKDKFEKIFIANCSEKKNRAGSELFELVWSIQ